MNIPTEAFIIAAVLIGAFVGFFAAALFNVGKSRGQYNRGWNAGRDFARNYPDHL
jgi:hypothetical protein